MANRKIRSQLREMEAQTGNANRDQDFGTLIPNISND